MSSPSILKHSSLYHRLWVFTDKALYWNFGFASEGACGCLLKSESEGVATFTMDKVLVETLNRSVGKKDDVKQLWDDLHVNNIVIQLSDEDYLKSLEINGWFNNSINYSDCTIIQTMMSMGINRIVSFDGGFKKIGKYDVISAI